MAGLSYWSCQYTGTYCDIGQCTGHSDHYYNEGDQQCECQPTWLYDDTGICDGSHTKCVESGGLLPFGWNESGHSDPCVCSYPYRVDVTVVDGTTTLGTCVSDCGSYGTASGSTCACLPGGLFFGVYCNETLCDNGGTPDLATDNHGDAVYSDHCDCPFSQWDDNVYCNTSQCVAGTPRNTSSGLQGCNCYTGWSGELCDVSSGCGHHGSPSSQTASATCVCDPGWNGTDCSVNLCKLDVVNLTDHRAPLPVPCSTVEGATVECVYSDINYNCLCGDGFYASFDNSTGVGRCVNHTHVNCGPFGVWGTFEHNNSYHCICKDGWTGHRCDRHICHPSNETIRHKMVRVDNETDGFRYWQCQCITPEFYNLSAGCLMNCSHFEEVYPETTVRLINNASDPTKCVCDDGISVPDGAAPIWLNETYNATGKWSCRLPCHLPGTATITQTECVCESGYSGTYCDTYTDLVLTIPSAGLDAMPFYVPVILVGSVVVFGSLVFWWTSGRMPSFMYADDIEYQRQRDNFDAAVGTQPEPSVEGSFRQRLIRRE